MLTLQEIREQYTSMGQTKEYLSGYIDAIKKILDDNSESNIIFLGCGSSYSIAKSYAQNTMTGLKRVGLAMAAGDVLIHGDRYQAIFENAVVVAISRSGETTEIIQAVTKIREICKIQVISIVCKENSTASKISDLTLTMPWAFDNSVCQTRTVSCLYFAWLYIVGMLSENQAQLAELQLVVNHGDEYIKQWEAELEKMAALPWNHAVVLGDAELGGACEEGSLTFKEICQLPSNYYHMLDSRHGPMVMIGKETLVIMPISDHSPELQKALLEDLKKKGAAIIVYTNEAMELDGICNIYFGKNLSYPVMGLPFLAINQLVSYFKSGETGANPDQPDGLSPWIQL